MNNLGALPHLIESGLVCTQVAGAVHLRYLSVDRAHKGERY